MRPILTFLIVVAVGAEPLAECVALPPCEALQRSSIVFLGDAVSAGPIEERTGPNAFRLVPQQPVHFRVVERFKGVAQDKKEIEAVVADANGAEAVRFLAGRRYVVYASLRPDGKWSTNCSRSVTPEQQPAEVRELRNCTRR